MVIQAGEKAAVWGHADPGEKVIVRIAGRNFSTITGPDGKWKIKLNALKPSSTPIAMAVAGKNTLCVRNILVGQIWLGSGQSNMQWSLKQLGDIYREIPQASYPRLRLFETQRNTADTPIEDVNGVWTECSPETVADFSAVAYYFGRELLKNIDQPVGMINCSWGGTRIQSWYSPAAAPTDKKPRSDKPYDQFSAIYNGMIAPITPMTIKGVIWYQGESNADFPCNYYSQFPLMIEDWRRSFAQPQMPFYFVQIANFDISKRTMWPTDSWAFIRDAQKSALALPNTGMTVTIDIGEPDQIHPRNKLDVGRRLALIALNKCYGFKDEYSGPMFKNIKIKDNTARISFTHVDDGLSVDGATLQGFTAAGSDRKFFPASAELDSHNHKVLLTCPDVLKIESVRYAWSDNPETANLFNTAHLPASPFRTDKWPCHEEISRPNEK